MPAMSSPATSRAVLSWSTGVTVTPPPQGPRPRRACPLVIEGVEGRGRPTARPSGATAREAIPPRRTVLVAGARPAHVPAGLRETVGDVRGGRAHDVPPRPAAAGPAGRVRGGVPGADARPLATRPWLRRSPRPRPPGHGRWLPGHGSAAR